ncbi:MAG: T9SS type A sorting domain-containing protein, partial [Flavobacteriales bacterium]|nr:T9SS type A sorting domain-containing protein [Flavobacteriales bacterium]
QLPDGKFMCSGGSGLFEGVPVEPIFRVHDDGALDTSFHVPDLDGWIESYGFLPQPGGKVLAYGRFHFADMVPWTCLVRLLPNGQLDPTFNNQQWFEVTYGFWSAMVQDVEPIGEGLLAVTGTFDRINGEDHGGIAMLDTAGNLLPGYFEGSGCGGYFSYPYNDYYQGILGIEPAQDGGYYIYGYYRGYDDGATNDPSQRLLSKLYGLNVGINEQPARSATLHIAPNPSHGGAVQLSVDEVPKRAILSIHDASGRVVLREEWPDGTFTHTLQAGLLAPGTYVVRVAVPLASRASASGTDTYTGKMIVLP